MNNLTINHPWLANQIKKEIWKIFKWMNVRSFIYPLVDLDLKIKICTNNSIGRGIFFENYEKSTFLFMEKFIKRGDTVVDVGANIGIFTLIFSRLVGETGKVHSFEPSQREFISLCENVKINNLHNVFLNPLALSNKNGTFDMFILSNEAFGAYNSFKRVTHPTANDQEFQVQTVRAITFDDYLKMFPSSFPKLVKIDVEGFEKQVLEGMKNMLCTCNSPCLAIEMSESTQEGGQDSIQELIQLIEGHGYRIFGTNHQGNLKPFELGESLNAIALKESQINYVISNGVEIVGIS